MIGQGLCLSEAITKKEKKLQFTDPLENWK